MVSLSAVFGFFRFWRDRRNKYRIEIGYSFTGDPNLGNKVIVRNLGNIPVIVTYWELQWVTGRWPLLKRQAFTWADEFSHDIRIDAYSSQQFLFAGSEYFPWGKSQLGDRSIHLKLYIAGKKRPVLQKVYGS